MKPTNKLMKRLSLYLFLILFTFQTPSWADDIRDFEIEGMSIGDSLLDYFSEKEIKKNKADYYTDDKFTAVDFDFKEVPFSETYDGAQIHYETKSKKYIIYSLDFVRIFENSINECYKKQNEIEEDLSDMFTSAKKSKKIKEKHPEDRSGKSTVTSAYFNLDTGGYASVECYDWSEKMGYPDQIRVSITSKELSDWLNTPNIYK